jgi:D-xylulose kinase
MKDTGPCIVVADLGTSATKAGVFTLDGQELGTATAEYPAAYPHPTWAQQDASDWWQAAITTIKESMEKSGIKPGAVKAVSISGQAPSCLPIDRGGKPLRPAIIWIDRRATEEVDWIAENVGAEEVRRIAGNYIDGYFGGPKWLWFRNKEPELFARTWKIMQAHGYVIFRLTGEVVTDYSHAGLCSPCFNLQKKQWSPEMCEALRIPLSMLPELAPSYQVVGKIHAEGAKASGLPKGTPVVAGGGDFACATLGCGVIDVGQAAQMLGTAGNLLVPVGKSITPDSRLLNTVHLTGDYLMLGSMYAGGVLQWFRDQLGEPEIEEGKRVDKSPYRLLDEKAETLPPGAEGLILLPYLMGERTPIWDAHARGVYVGLTPYHTRAHMYRAALEGVAFGFRHMAEIIEQQGVQIKEVIAVNGGAKSPLWRQIFADVLNARINYYVGGAATLLGDVALAGVGTGCFEDLGVVRKWQEILETQNPDPEKHELYTRYYALYRKTYEQLKEVFGDLVRVGKIREG